MQRTQTRPSLTRRSYSAPYKAQVVGRFLAGDKTVAEVADEFELREPTVRRWIQRAASASVTPRPALSDAIVDQTPVAWGDWPAQVPADWYDADTVRWIQESGMEISEAAYRLGVPSTTLYRWLELASAAVR